MDLRIFLVVGVIFLQACTPALLWGYGPDGQSLHDFEQRVEAAFRLQNKMTSEVMLLQDADIGRKNQETILDAEQDMQKKCSYLNEYAVRDIDGLSKGLLLQRRVEKSVAPCENAANLLKTLINAH